MKNERDKLIEDFVRWAEQQIEGTPTVKVPPTANIPKDVAEIARYLERELAIRDVEDTGVHRLEVIHRAMLSAKPQAPPPAPAPDPRLDSLLMWKRKAPALLLTIIGVLIAAIAALAMKLIDSAGREPRHEPTEERRK